MLCWCPYSNTNYRTDNFRGKWKGVINAPHPIFYAPTDSLLQRSADLVSGSLSPQEARLVFLALLYSTELVSFEHPADPQPGTVLTNAEALVSFISWREALASPTLKFPLLVVRHHNRSLVNIDHWLFSCNEVKEAWEQRNSSHRLRAKLAQKEAALQRLLSSTTKRPNYTLKLAAWALEAASVPAALHEYWTQLFCLTSFDIHKPEFSLADFSELREHMEHNLPVYNSPTYSNAVLHHVRKLEEIRAKGLDYWLGLSVTGATSEEEAEANNFRFIDDSVEAHNVATVIEAYGTDEEPLLHQFPNKVAWLRAKAAWTLSKERRKQADELMRRKLAAEQQETLDNIAASELLEETAALDAAELSSITGAAAGNISEEDI